MSYNDVFEIIIITWEVFLVYEFIMLLINWQCGIGKKEYLMGAAAAGLSGLVFYVGLEFGFINRILLIFLEMIMTTLILCINEKEHKDMALLLTVIAYMGREVMDNALTPLTSIIIGIFRVKDISGYACYLLPLIIVRALYIGLFLKLLKKQKQQTSQNQTTNQYHFQITSYYPLLGIIAVFMFIALLCSFRIHRISSFAFLDNFILLSLVLIMIVITAIYYRYMNITENERVVKLRNELLEDNYSNMYERYLEGSSVVHDFKNHLELLHQYLEDGNSQQALHYIDKIREPVEKMQERVLSGNQAADLIINSKMAEARKLGIQVDTEIDYFQKLTVEDSDLCIIMGNLLDNALDACKLAKDENPWINILMKRKEQILFIQISNSMKIKPVERNGKLLSIKTDSGFHGMGLNSVRLTSAKYAGIVEYRYDEHKFTAFVTLY